MASAHGQKPLSVSQLTGRIKGRLESSFQNLWVEGEISNYRPQRSGHIYLTLKDQTAQIAAVVWRTTAQRIRFKPQDGLEVIVRGRLTVYEPQGKYQLVVDQVQPKGLGALELAFRQLRGKLEQEGLFQPGRKKPIPVFPNRIVLVTSPSGAAVRDMLQVIERRWPSTRVLIIPVRVQGDGAAQEIAWAIRTANKLAGVDTLIVARGGGSLEDLWAFNEEAVARAIASSAIPVISGVGHEIDVTIADLVADRRALTPTEAAELAVPDRREIQQRLDRTVMQMTNLLVDRIRTGRFRLEQLASRPGFRYPFDRIAKLRQGCDELQSRLAHSLKYSVQRAQHRLEKSAALFETLSPLKVLARGYSLTRLAEGGPVVRSSGQVGVGDLLSTRLGEGAVISRVERIEHSKDERDDGN